MPQPHWSQTQGRRGGSRGGAECRRLPESVSWPLLSPARVRRSRHLSPGHDWRRLARFQGGKLGAFVRSQRLVEVLDRAFVRSQRLVEVLDRTFVRSQRLVEVPDREFANARLVIFGPRLAIAANTNDRGAIGVEIIRPVFAPPFKFRRIED